MSIFREFLAALQQLLLWWVIVAPWEQAVRVRLGKYLRVLNAGIHFRIPFIDKIFLQSTRLRFTDMPAQTITTADGKTVTLTGTVGYTIDDIRLLYETLHHANDTIMNLTMASVAKYVRGRRLNECVPTEIEKFVSDNVHLDKYGLGHARFSLLDFAVVRTFRLIQSAKWSSGEQLTTTECSK